MPLPPLRFKPILKPKVWGGRLLEGLGKSLPPEKSIGESWELADLPESIQDGRSVIDGGPFDTQLLRDVTEHDARALLGRTALSPEGGFPLLLKFLDANDNLSVQVHPDEPYVATHPEAHLKSEAWFILEAKPDGVIYAGLKPGVDRDRLAAAIQDGSVVDHLVSIPAIPGDCHYLPSGTCHALGAGVLVAEVQTPSDTTFRIWDWGRTERELHVEQGLACIDFSGRDIRTPPQQPQTHHDRRTTCLVDESHFRIDRIEKTGDGPLALPSSDVPEAFMVLSGQGDLVHQDGTMPVAKGDTVLLPADRLTCVIETADALELLMVTMRAGDLNP